MIEVETFRFEQYELACSARVSDNGHFEPLLIITKRVWPTRPRTIAVRRGGHPSVEGAIAAARAQGIEWVANYG